MTNVKQFCLGKENNEFYGFDLIVDWSCRNDGFDSVRANCTLFATAQSVESNRSVGQQSWKNWSLDGYGIATGKNRAQTRPLFDCIQLFARHIAWSRLDAFRCWTNYVLDLNLNFKFSFWVKCDCVRKCGGDAVSVVNQMSSPTSLMGRWEITWMLCEYRLVQLWPFQPIKLNAMEWLAHYVVERIPLTPASASRTLESHHPQSILTHRVTVSKNFELSRFQSTPDLSKPLENHAHTQFRLETQHIFWCKHSRLVRATRNEPLC